MDDKVLFAGYRAPHPLEHRIEIKVQTSGESTPRDAVIGALTNLQTQLQTLKSQFLVSFDITASHNYIITPFSSYKLVTLNLTP